jgi:hypothetical protein
MHPCHHSLANKEGHAQAPRTVKPDGLLSQLFVSRDQCLRLRYIQRAVRRIQRSFFSCRPSARSMLRGWAVIAKRSRIAAAKSTAPMEGSLARS